MLSSFGLTAPSSPIGSSLCTRVLPYSLPYRPLPSTLLYDSCSACLLPTVYPGNMPHNGLLYCHTLYRQLHRSATSVLKIQLTEIDVYWWFDRPLPDSSTGLPIDPLLLIEKPLTIKRRRGHLASSTASSTHRGCINTLTHREPLAFKRNTKYTNRRRRYGRGRRRRGKGNSSQISLSTPSQITTQSTQLTQE